AFVGRSYTNQGRALTSGVDLQVDWSGQFEFGRLGVNVLANYNLENITQTSDDVPQVDWVGTNGRELGLQCIGYDYRLFSTLSWFQGPWIASLRWRYFPDIRSGAAGRTPDTRLRGVHSSYSNFSLASGFNVNEFLSLRVGIDNLFDKL